MVYEKYAGHCAYCGCELDYKDMQVDHIESVWANEYKTLYQNQEGLSTEEMDNFANYMPACRACNFYKSSSSLEKFRENLSTTLYNNLQDNFNYKLLKKYGLIQENIHPVEFYFEKIIR